MKSIIGVDIGGTAIKAGLLSEHGLQKKLSAPSPKSAEDLVRVVIQLTQELLPDRTPSCCGVAVAGLLSPDEKEVLNSPNLRWIENFPLQAALADALSCPVFLVNDATAAAQGEIRFGIGTTHPSFLLATLGTGVGGGVVLDGKLWTGSGGLAGEFGHMKVGHEARCACGTIGCLEAVASASAMQRHAKQENIPGSLAEIADTARHGDSKAKSVFEQAGSYLGQAFGQVALLMDLRVLVLGGGAGPCADLLRDAALTTTAKQAFGRTVEDFSVLASPLGNDAGVLGAGVFASET